MAYFDLSLFGKFMQVEVDKAGAIIRKSLERENEALLSFKNNYITQEDS